jgi:hypothetical protein
LRGEDFRVFGGGRFADAMEHDRDACLRLVGEYGLTPPPSQPFTDTAAAIAFLERNAERAFADNPDVGETYETWLPPSENAIEANRELRQHLRSRTGEVSFVLRERKDGVEADVECERFGYQAHPNLLWNLCRAPLGDVFASLVDGSFTPDFVPGFGATVTLYMDHALRGTTVAFPDAVSRQLYLIDVYREEDRLLTAGSYGDAVPLACDFGYTIPTAWDAAMEVARQVHFSGRSYRLDGGGTDFPSFPLRWFEALTAMGFL